MFRKYLWILVLVIPFFILIFFPKSETKYYYNPKIKRYIIPWYNNTFIYTFNNPKEIIKEFRKNITFFNYKYVYNFSRIYFIYDPYLTGNFSLGIVSLLNHIVIPLRRLGFNVTYVCLKPYNSTYCQIIGNESLCKGKVFCIVYKEGKENISLIENKLYIVGNQTNILKLVDLVVLRFYGIEIN